MVLVTCHYNLPMLITQFTSKFKLLFITQTDYFTAYTRTYTLAKYFFYMYLAKSVDKVYILYTFKLKISLIKSER